MHVLLEIIGIDLLRLCVFQLKYLQLAQTVRIALEIDAIGLDLCLFHSKLFQLAQTMRVPVEIVAIGSDYAHSN